MALSFRLFYLLYVLDYTVFPGLISTFRGVLMVQSIRAIEISPVRSKNELIQCLKTNLILLFDINKSFYQVCTLWIIKYINLIPFNLFTFQFVQIYDLRRKISLLINIIFVAFLQTLKCVAIDEIVSLLLYFINALFLLFFYELAQFFFFFICRRTFLNVRFLLYCFD